MRQVDPIAAEEAFRAKLREAGLVPPDSLHTDGKLVRIGVDGKNPGKRDGFYVYHSDGIPAGAYGDWSDRDGWNTWCFFNTSELSREELEDHKRRLDRARAARSEEEKSIRAEAQARANRIWNSATECQEHPYLTRKQVRAFGIREVQGRLVVPVMDRDGQIHSLEFIDADGTKMFLSGGRKAGCWFGLGERGSVLCVAEGYATGASIHEATGHYVAVAFDCGNLSAVAKALREMHPTARILICEDDDQKTKGNPGASAAAKAAQAVNGLIAVPDLPQGGDFNDQHAVKGLESVRDTIDETIKSDRGPIDACDLFPMVMGEIIARKEGKSRNTLSTGIKSVDNLTRRMFRGNVIVIGGLPGSGKTSAALGIVEHNAARGVPCYVVSIEMDRFEIGVRILSHNSSVPASDIFDDRVRLNCERLRWGDIMEANGRMEKILLTLDDRPLTLAEIVEQAHLWFATKVRAAGHDFGLIAVDYLGLIKSEDRGENRNREVAEMCKGLKVLARTLRCPLILCAQLNRAPTKRGGEPELSDLRDSGEIEAVADLAIFPWPWPRQIVKDEQTGELRTEKKQAKPGEDDSDVWIVRKNRNGPKGAARVLWRPEVMQYTDVIRDYDGPDTRPSWQDGRDSE